MNKILTPKGVNTRPQLGEPVIRMAQETLKRHPELETLTKAVRYLCVVGYEADTGKPAPEKAVALIESEQKG